jgi:hypothetical protein
MYVERDLLQIKSIEQIPDFNRLIPLATELLELLPLVDHRLRLYFCRTGKGGRWIS